MDAAPAVPAGVVNVIVVELTTTTFVAGCPPISTVAPFRNPAPEIVTGVPPAVDPLVGEADATIGAPASTVMVRLEVVDPPHPFSTRSVNVDVPGVVGVPESSPVVSSNASPAGSDPLLTVIE